MSLSAVFSSLIKGGVWLKHSQTLQNTPKHSQTLIVSTYSLKKKYLVLHSSSFCVYGGLGIPQLSYKTGESGKRPIISLFLKKIRKMKKKFSLMFFFTKLRYYHYISLKNYEDNQIFEINSKSTPFC
jgi:hypothetical protein